MLTKKQYKLLQFLDTYSRKHGAGPSYDEMREALELKSKSGIHSLINALVERGFCRRLENRARAVEIIKTPANQLRDFTGDNVQSAADTMGYYDDHVSQPIVSLPLYGSIAAGLPIEAFQNEDEKVDVPAYLLGPSAAQSSKDFFALRISGDSMKEAGILNGDIVILRRCVFAPEGTIVAALIDSAEVTLKRVSYKSAEEVVLEPANRDHVSQSYDAGRVKIQGRLINLMRRYE